MTEKKPPNLWIWRRDGILLAKVQSELERLGLFGGVSFALAMSPAAFQILEVREGGFHDKKGLADLVDVYDLRLFGASCDARWQKAGDVGSLTVTTETQPSAVTGWGAPVTLAIAETLHRRYQLFGTVRAVAERWSDLREPRVPTIQVPINASPNASIALLAIEYFGRGPDGNAVLLAERLTTFSSQTSKEFIREQ
jgi:CRISPR-associated protein (TIGR03984 family)